MHHRKNLGTALLTTTLLLGIPLVHAHSALTEATPAKGATVTEAPAKLELTFSQPLYLTYVAVTAGDGEPQVLEMLKRQMKTDYALALPVLAPSHYNVEWRGMSGDGHVMRGSFDFTVKAE